MSLLLSKPTTALKRYFFMFLPISSRNLLLQLTSLFYFLVKNYHQATNILTFLSSETIRATAITTKTEQSCETTFPSNAIFLFFRLQQNSSKSCLFYCLKFLMMAQGLLNPYNFFFFTFLHYAKTNHFLSHHSPDTARCEG